MPPGHYPHLPERTTRSLIDDLHRRVDGEIRFSDGDRALYASDSSNYREVPIGVVIPRSVEGIAKTVEICHEHDVPVLHRGGGTSLAGQCTNTAVVIDSSKYCDSILEMDAERRIARVEPGVNLDNLNKEAGKFGLFFGPDPSTHSWNTVGGMIGNNSGGPHSVAWGLTVEHVESLEVMTYDGTRMTLGAHPEHTIPTIRHSGGRKGEIVDKLLELRDRHADLIRARFPDIPRRVSGYNLDQLLPEKGFHLARAVVGSEGTCVTILEATLRLVPYPQQRVMLIAGFKSVFDAADAVVTAREHGAIAIEGIDHRLVENMRKKHLHTSNLRFLPEGDSWLVVQFASEEKDEAKNQAQKLKEVFEASSVIEEVKLIEKEEERQAIWTVRESGLGATAFVPGEKRDHWPGWEDSAVSPEDLGNYLRDLAKLYDKYDYHGALYGHFGDGLVHTRIDFGLHTQEDVSRFRSFLNESAELVTRYHGSLSGEHGDGQARSQLLEIMYGPEVVRLFEEFKAIWDPDGRMNPGRIVHPRPINVDLRLGPRFRPPQLDTVFSFHEDDFSFARATTRCVGVGRCRRAEGGTMCPSYRATQEEKHSTRGRAHLLVEMLQGDPLRDGWASEAVHEALDLCLACKGCKSDCPVNVDMATYKSEFLHHHYKHHARPRGAWFFGRIHRLARLAGPAPWLANVATQTPYLRDIAGWVADVHPDRRLPPFAARTFRQGWQGMPLDRPERGLVVLWTDSFNNHFTPEVLDAAAEVIAAAGYRVVIPRQNLCCGRPLYDYGWLEEAKSLLQETMESLAPSLEKGAYVVGVEPSCLAVFRDELWNLFPDDPLAKELGNRTMLLGEFLDKVAKFEPPRLARKAMLRGHCHHKAIFGMESDQKILGQACRDVELLDDGCCGMAGAFGYEAHKYPVSMAVAEDKTLPAVRKADPGTLLVCDGYSCREQILQATGRRVLTLPEVLQKALVEGEYANFPVYDRRLRQAERQATLTALGGAALAMGGMAFLAWRGARERRRIEA